ncbi:uncharacterized protein LOC131229788 isoform X2 [Magnolia sinica]|uniref:uncharacterized protein LOC131229788 isoform X2 n=1 Tax=Magnolia sinica TaxID=86752 RepID=UPI00265837F2|nr:uncharacterized protein LOC131229788 isoform X2 [Magnolia sinica]
MFWRAEHGPRSSELKTQIRIPSKMDAKHSAEMLKHLEKQSEVLMEAYRSMSHELHRLQVPCQIYSVISFVLHMVEEEMLMRKFYELMSAQGLVKKLSFIRFHVANRQ